MGRSAAELPDELVFGLLKAGFTTPCYDGQYFFDADHPVGVNNAVVSVSNFQGGTGEPWFLLDCSRPLKAMIFQERRALGALVRKDQPDDDNVFWRKEFVYGSDGRCNAGFGLWQLAHASRQPLTPANYEAARKAMMALRGDEGRPLGVKPDVLVCGSALEGAAMRLLNNGTRIEIPDGSTTPVAVQNEWAGTAKPIVTAWLDAA
jgi:phage major head subunit gpT-like protein